MRGSCASVVSSAVLMLILAVAVLVGVVVVTGVMTGVVTGACMCAVAEAIGVSRIIDSGSPAHAESASKSHITYLKRGIICC